jgi:hypothetical protein
MYLSHKYLFYSSQLTQGKLETNKAAIEKLLKHHFLSVKRLQNKILLIHRGPALPIRSMFLIQIVLPEYLIYSAQLIQLMPHKNI